MLRRAFTIVELLVVIAIIAILLGLLLPAVQTARVTVARVQCSNNLHQLVVATHAYHDAERRFPSGVNLPISSQSGAVFTSNPLHTSGKIKEPVNPAQFISWPEALLPFYDQENLQLALDLRQREYANTLGPDSTGAQLIHILLCPSDPISNPVTTYSTGGQTYYFGMNSYGANGGTRSWYVTNMTTNGMFWINSDVRIDQITDGAGNTIMYGERHHFDPGFPEIQELGGWAWANYFAPQDYILSAAVPVNYQIPKGVSPTTPMKDDRVCAYGSGHPGGANFAMCDGSVRFLTLASNKDLRVLQALSTRGGSETVNVP